jgi:beta-phosphoglucomutase-like phosphatase (HAD superfamily)
LIEIISKYKAFIFDFDGVIVDSLTIKAEAFAELFLSWGPEAAQEIKRHHLANGGVSRYEKFKQYFRAFKSREITAQESADLDHRYADLVVKKVIGAPLIPGVSAFLGSIKELGKPCFVVSATPLKEIEYIVEMREMNKFFDLVLGSPVSKNDNVRRLLDEKKLKGADLVYFGDAKSDYEAASNGGVDFIGVISTPESELKKVPGISWIKDFSDGNLNV